MDQQKIENLRADYTANSLSENNTKADPIKQFEAWFAEAEAAKEPEFNAMNLATATSDGRPSARIVLLKGIYPDGFVFYTNYLSRKGKEIEKNPFVSLLFFWKELERQVRIEGNIKKISAEESDEYFSQRPFESRIGAWSSPQSSVIENREVLQKNVEKYNLKFGTQPIPRPEYWGGYMVSPNRMEFWQGRPGRLHDRLQYSLSENDEWIINRLAP